VDARKNETTRSGARPKEMKTKGKDVTVKLSKLNFFD
jgi:hypothetical protein